MKPTVKDAIPVFSTLEEEREYWESRGLLDETRKTKTNKAKTKRASFLNIRLSGEELTQLRDLAASAGTGPSTFVRLLILNTLEKTVKSKYASHHRLQTEAIFARDADFPGAKPDSIALVELGKAKIDPEVVRSLFETLQKTCECTVLNPQDAGYAEIDRLLTDKRSTP